MAAYVIIAEADNADGKIDRGDLTYIHAKLEDVLTFNSMPATEPRSNPQFLDRLRTLSRKMLP